MTTPQDGDDETRTADGNKDVVLTAGRLALALMVLATIVGLAGGGATMLVRSEINAYSDRAPFQRKPEADLRYSEVQRQLVELQASDHEQKEAIRELENRLRQLSEENAVLKAKLEAKCAR